MGLEFPPHIVAQLQGKFGGRPFFTREVRSKIHQLASPSRPLRVSDSALNRATTEFQGQLESYLRDIIEQLKEDYPEEFSILAAVLSGNLQEISEYGNEAPELIDHLIGYGLVERVGNDFDIRFSAIKGALEHVFSNGLVDRWLEISKRRNMVESGIRTALFHWCKTISAEEWQVLVSSNISRSRYKDLQSTEPRVLFSQEGSPLYLSDLLVLLNDPKILPFLDDRRSEIVKAIDVLNKIRKDAHALAVSDADFNAVRAALDYLETEFSGP